MCGIVGILGEDKKKKVRKMMDILKHRGPDGDGMFINDKAALGHTRLSIIDIDTGSQPISNEDDTVQIVANGEIYNYKELKNKLVGHRFKSKSDSEVIIHLYEEDGVEVFSKLDGMFAIAILDDQDLILARDPLGIKSLYYSDHQGDFYFASEIKALLPYCSDIKEFPSGHYYHSRFGFKKYFEIIPEIDRNCDISDISSNLYNEFDRSVRKRLMSDVPLGVFLSGGLDSSLTSAFAKKYKEDLHSFSVGVKKSPDSDYAYQVAKFLGTNHHEYILNADEMLQAIPDVIYHLESFDAALVRSSIPNYFLCKMTKEYVTVVLSGEGADELFAGYSYLEEIENDEKLGDELLYITNRLHNTNLQRVDRMTMAHGIEGRVPFLDEKMVQLAFSIPVRQKMDRRKKIEKLILKKAFKNELPENVINRKKEKFSIGCGSAMEVQKVIEKQVSDNDFKRERVLENGYALSSKEELYYYRIFQEVFERKINLELVGKSRSL
jgi:asparagine synthase (glutamine-hydrolysing)